MRVVLAAFLFSQVALGYYGNMGYCVQTMMGPLYPHPTPAETQGDKIRQKYEGRSVVIHMKVGGKLIRKTGTIKNVSNPAAAYDSKYGVYIELDGGGKIEQKMTEAAIQEIL